MTINATQTARMLNYQLRALAFANNHFKLTADVLKEMQDQQPNPEDDTHGLYDEIMHMAAWADRINSQMEDLEVYMKKIQQQAEAPAK